MTPGNTRVSAILHEPVSPTTDSDINAGTQPFRQIPIPPGSTTEGFVERRQAVSGNITGREIRLAGKAHDINRLRTACDKALKEAETRGDLDGEFIVHADPPQEDER